MQWLPLGIEVRAGLHTGECEVRGDRGTHDLKGVPGEWRLFAVASA
jgi:class 3 adenylate cyclase